MSQPNFNISKIDSHQHFWLLSRGDYQWLTPELALLYRDYLPQELSAELQNANVSETIVVQATNTEAETVFLLKIAYETSFVTGVVGWVDMESTEVLSTLNSFSKNPYFKGIRPMLQDMDDIDWILYNKFSPIFEFLIANNLSFDALVREHQLSIICQLAQLYPSLKIVINHCAKPNVEQSPSDTWHIEIEHFKYLNNVSVKLSGLLTEAAIGDVKYAQLMPYFKQIISIFGTKRIMWGSDWPVLKLNGDYEKWACLTQALLQKCSHEEQQNIWANNARRFYNLST